MKQHIEPTPAIHAASLKSSLITASLYDEEDIDTSLRDLLADMMHLIDAEKDCSSFNALCERARWHYTAEVEGLEDKQKGRTA